MKEHGNALPSFSFPGDFFLCGETERNAHLPCKDMRGKIDDAQIEAMNLVTLKTENAFCVLESVYCVGGRHREIRNYENLAFRFYNGVKLCEQFFCLKYVYSITCLVCKIFFYIQNQMQSRKK